MRKLNLDAPQFIKIHSPFPEGWDQWRFTEGGRYLVHGRQYITQERLKGLLWQDHMRLMADGYASRRAAEAAKKRSG